MFQNTENIRLRSSQILYIFEFSTKTTSCEFQLVWKGFSVRDTKIHNISRPNFTNFTMLFLAVVEGFILFATSDEVLVQKGVVHWPL